MAQDKVFKCAVGQQGRGTSQQTGRGGGGRGGPPGRGGSMNRPMPPRKNTVAGNLQQQQQQRPQQSRPQQPRPQQPSSNPRQHQPQQRDYDDGPVMNSEIRCAEVRVLDARKQSIGVMPTSEAVSLASEQGVDLIMLNPEASPPLVRLVQLNKLKYEQSKAEKDQRKKQRESRQDLKELRFRPNTEEHDYHVRLKNAKKFISKGDKVKLTMRFKGREMEFREVAKEMFERFVGDLGDDISISQGASMQGYTMTLIISPLIKK